MEKIKYKCVLCKQKRLGFGNNPFPLSKTGRCCNRCNIDVVVSRISKMNGGMSREAMRELKKGLTMAYRIKMPMTSK